MPGSAWAAIACQTLLTALVVAWVSFAVAQAVTAPSLQHWDTAGFAAAVALPAIVAPLLMFYHLVRVQRLHHANQKLQVLASTDWLTTCLNRRAFTQQVMGDLRTALKGAFLVIDADNFKVINDHFGHDGGDEALQLMAETIKTHVRDGDLVGRIGGEEFGVFLNGATLDTAGTVAERIRDAIASAKFAPEGMVHSLSVSVGGAFFEGRITFANLFRIADQRLYGAKQKGRNRVELAHVADHPPVNAATLRSAAA